MEQRSRPPAGPPASRLTARQLYQVIAPRRRRYAWWCAGVAASWVGIFLYVYIEDCSRSRFPAWTEWGKLIAYLGVYLASLSPLVTLPGAVLADVRANRLEPLLLTTADRKTVARAYHLRAFETATLLLAMLAPIQIASGQGFEPLMWVREVLPYDCGHSLLRDATHGASALLAQFGLAYLAAALGLAASAWLRSRTWGTMLAAGGAALFGAMARSHASWWLDCFRNSGIRWYTEPYCDCGAGGGTAEPGFTLLLWTFAAICALAAFVLGELLLYLAARRLDRLVSD
jgi:hypothetical protein